MLFLTFQGHCTQLPNVGWVKKQPIASIHTGTQHACIFKRKSRKKQAKSDPKYMTSDDIPLVKKRLMWLCFFFSLVEKLISKGRRLRYSKKRCVLGKAPAKSEFAKTLHPMQPETMLFSFMTKSGPDLLLNSCLTGKIGVIFQKTLNYKPRDASFCNHHQRQSYLVQLRKNVNLHFSEQDCLQIFCNSAKLCTVTPQGPYSLHYIHLNALISRMQRHSDYS